MRLFKTPEGAEYPEHETIARYKSPFVEWVCLNTTKPGDEQRSCKFYALCNLTDVTPGIDCRWMRGMRQFVRQQFDSGLEYTVAEKPVAEVIHETAAEPGRKVVIEMTADMLRSVVGSHGVDIRVVEKPVTAIVLRESVYEWRLAS